MRESFRPTTKRIEKVAADPFTKRAEELIKKVDFGLLRNIFSEEKRRSGLASEDANLQTSTADLMLKPIFPSNLGEYIPWLNKISTSPKNIAEERGERNFENAFFSVICHEETHSVATNPHRQSGIPQLMRFVANRPSSQTGFRYRTLQRPEAFRMFNEGTTDRVAEDIYAEYVHRSGDRALFPHENGTTAYMPAYLNERNILQAFISALSRATEVPEDVVWNGIKRSYFANADLADNDLVKLYEEVLGVNVVKIIENPTASRGISWNAIRQLKEIEPREVDEFSRELASSMKTVGWSDELKKRAVEALEKFLPGQTRAPA